MGEGLNRTGPGGPERAVATDDRAADAPRGRGLALGSGHRASPRAISPHAEKFRVAIATLIGIAIGALALAAALIVSGSSRTASLPWSAWSPSDGGKLGASEIADHVAPFYRQTSADQLDVVTLVSLANPNATGTTSGSGLQVAVNTAGGASSTGGLSLLGGKTIAYNLCGLGGSNCQLRGTPSTNRLLLLRREALELALYTFKYISGTDNVVAVLPPGHTQTTSTLSPKLPSASTSTGVKPMTVAVLFVRSELSPWLAQPLGQTLQEFPPATQQLPQWRKTQEAGLVDQITARGLFSERIESAQDGSNLLVLNSLPPQ
jgi:hypothetical protein